MPRHTSKILSTAKKPQTTATALIGEFDRKGFTGAGDTYLRKVDKKDLSEYNFMILIWFRGCSDSWGLGDQVPGGMGEVQGGTGGHSAAQRQNVILARTLHHARVRVPKDNRADREGYRNTLHEATRTYLGARWERSFAHGCRPDGRWEPRGSRTWPSLEGEKRGVGELETHQDHSFALWRAIEVYSCGADLDCQSVGQG
jgi:hypothetical protein